MQEKSAALALKRQAVDRGDPECRKCGGFAAAARPAV